MIKWKKLGLLYSNKIQDFTHASHPAMIQVDNNLYLLAFSSRKNQKSHIVLAHAEIKNDLIKVVSEPKIALKPSQPGYFDSDGLLCCCLVKHKEKFYLYYTGWVNVEKNLWHCDTGRAILDTKNLKAEREFDGPIFGRDKHNPIFAAATAVKIENNIWKSWYNSGISWSKKNNEWHPKYGIHYATSNDGIDWKSRPGIIIPFKDQFEHSFGRPSVIKINKMYHMWFSHRGANQNSKYRMGYAYSMDGINWNRDDNKSGINISNSGWDSESICYPYVIKHEKSFFMLYCGNNYGETGFGYAIS